MNFVRVFAVCALCLTALSGCGTADVGHSSLAADGAPATATDPAADPATSASASANLAAPAGPAAVSASATDVSAALAGSDPSDDLSIAKKQYRQGNFGLAERYFRRAVEAHPRDGEAWLGLAAAYDRLKRFDLADRAYARVLTIVGPTAEVLNNEGYSYMLRGDYARARSKFAAARAADPKNPYVANNVRLLNVAAANGKGIR